MNDSESLDHLFVKPKLEAKAAPTHEGHHPFGFSALQKLSVCAGYRAQEDSEGDSASRAGDAGHVALQSAVEAYVDVAFSDDIEPVEFSHYVSEACVELGLEDWDKFLVGRAAEQLDGMMQLIKESGGHVITEDRMYLRGQSGVDISYGHPDLIWVDPTETIAQVKDYKFGKIEVPPAEQNMQGWAIAVALTQMFPSLVSVEVSFLHPQIQEWTTHAFSTDDLQEKLKIIDAVVGRASSQHKRLIPGDHCHYCRHREGCPALFRALENASVSIGDPLVDFPKLYNGMVPDDLEAAAAVIYYIKLFEEHAKDWKVQARSVIERHGNSATVSLKDGTHIDYTITTSKPSDRLTAKSTEIAQVLAGLVTTEDLLGLANKPALGKLEALAVEKMQQKFIDAGAEPPTKKVLSEKFREMCKSKGILKSGDPGDATSSIRQTKPKK